MRAENMLTRKYMKRYFFALIVFLIGCIGTFAQQRTENMSAYQCATYGRELFDMGMYKEALPYIKKAAEYGYADAHLMAGWMFQNGKGVKTNYKVAMREYNSGAAKGNANCYNNLGNMHEKGQGIEKSPQTAFNLYKKAEEKGSKIGKYNVGRCYEYGIGVEINLSKAAKYYDPGEDYSRVSKKIQQKQLYSALDSTQVGMKSPQIILGRCANSIIDNNEHRSKRFIPDFGFCHYHYDYVFDINTLIKTEECYLLVFNHEPMNSVKLSIVQQFYDKYRTAKMRTNCWDPCYFSYYDRVSPFAKIIEISDNIKTDEQRSWALFDGATYKSKHHTRQYFGIGDYSIYDGSGNKAVTITWADFAVILDKDGTILWRGNLFEKENTPDIAINPEITALFEEKHKIGWSKIIDKVVDEYDVFKFGFPNIPVYISNFNKGKYELSFYGNPQFFPKEYEYKIKQNENTTSYLTFSLKNDDFTEEQLKQLKTRALNQFKTNSPKVYRLTLGWNDLRYSGKRVIYNSESNTWRSTDIGEKFDNSDQESDIAKRYDKSPTIRNRLYFLSSDNLKWSSFEKELSGNEETDIVIVRIKPTEQICRKFLEMYPQSKYYDMVLEMYLYNKKGKVDYKKD